MIDNLIQLFALIGVFAGAVIVLLIGIGFWIDRNRK